VYAGLRRRIGKRKVSRFIENLVRPHVEEKALEAAYREMAQDEQREREALEWADAFVGDIKDEPR